MKNKKTSGFFGGFGNWASGFMTKLGEMGCDSSNRRMNQNDAQFYTAQTKIAQDNLNNSERRFWRKERDKAARRQERADAENKSFVYSCFAVGVAIASVLFLRK